MSALSSGGRRLITAAAGFQPRTIRTDLSAPSLLARRRARGMGDEGQPSAVAERGSFVVIGYLLWQLSRISAVWPAEIRAKAALCTGPG